MFGIIKNLEAYWTPTFAGVTTFCEAINLVLSAQSAVSVDVYVGFESELKSVV
jgi:hypothetical protein